jgi:hypothetical protein
MYEIYEKNLKTIFSKITNKSSIDLCGMSLHRKKTEYDSKRIVLKIQRRDNKSYVTSWQNHYKSNYPKVNDVFLVACNF